MSNTSRDKRSRSSKSNKSLQDKIVLAMDKAQSNFRASKHRVNNAKYFSDLTLGTIFLKDITKINKK